MSTWDWVAVTVLSLTTLLPKPLFAQAGKDIGTVIYVVTVVRNRVSDRRRALPADGCDKEKYEPL